MAFESCFLAAATASLTARLRGKDPAQRSDDEWTLPSMEQPEDSEAEDNNAASSVDKVSKAVRANQSAVRHFAGQGLRRHPKNEPYKLFVNPSPALYPNGYPTRVGHSDFASTYTGFATANKYDEPMYVGSVIQFEEEPGVQIHWIGEKSWLRPHVPALLTVPSRKQYPNYVIGLKYAGENIDWNSTVKDRIDTILNSPSFIDEVRKMNFVKQPFQGPLLATIGMQPPDFYYSYLAPR